MDQLARSFAAAATERDWCAVVDDAGTVSARGLLAQARELADLLAQGSQGPPTVLVQAENSRRLVVAGLATGLVGGTLAIASAHFGPADVAATMRAVRPDVVLGSPVRLAEWCVADSPRMGEAMDGWVVHGSSGRRDSARWQGGVLIGMTSGSTGHPKGVVHGESALQYAADNEISAARLQPGDAVGVIVPLSAAPAFAFGIYLAVRLQSPVLLSSHWDPDKALERLVRGSARWLMCVPTQVLQLAAAARGRPSGVLSGMSAITVGGGPMDAAALASAEDVLGVRLLRVFGMAECLGHTTPSLDDPRAIRLGRDGRPFPGTSVRAVDEAGRSLPPGEVGRAQVKGPSLFLGYAVDGRLDPPALTPDGYFETGDLIEFDSDGAMLVAGRIKDVIIRGGRNISVAEVETALLADPRICEACAVAIPDEILGERVAAVLVGSERDLTLDEVLSGLAARGVARANWPEYVVCVPALPTTHAGKLSRKQAKQLAIDALS